MSSARIATLVSASLCVTALAASAGPSSQGPSDPREGAATRPLWIDLDGDQLPDLYSFAPGRADVFLRNLGDGRFADATREAGLGANASRAATVLDFDGDDVSDLLLVSATGGLHLFQGEGAGSFQDVTHALGLHELAGITHAAPVDFDEDGWADLLLETEAGLPLFVRGLDGMRFEPLTIEVEPGEPGPLVAPTFVGVDASGQVDAAAAAATGHGVDRPAGADAVPRAASRRRALGAAAPSTPGNGGATPTTPGIEEMVMMADPPGALWAETLQDQNDPMSYIGAASVPVEGMLYPLSENLFVRSNGYVGLGTLNPQQQLEVDGDSLMGGDVNILYDLFVGANMQVGGFTHFQDGVIVLDDLSVAGNLSATSFSEDAVFEGDLDLQADISVAGHLDASSADIGNLSVTSNASLPFVTGPIDMDGPISSVSTASFASTSTTSAVRGSGAAGPTRGHLGAAGLNAFDGVASANWNGYELGVVGISTGASSSDNYGVMGHSNWVGVRGEHSLAPTVDYAELGRAGIGVRASGSSLAGEFLGDVDVSSDLDVGGSLNLSGPVASTSVAEFTGGSVAPAVEGIGINGPTTGFLGVQGATDFNGVTSADWAGDEVGVVGISTGGSLVDNYGVVGHSNHVGVRGENSANPSGDYAELGLVGIGILADGANLAGRFLGNVDVTGTLDVVQAINVTGQNAAVTASQIISNNLLWVNATEGLVAPPFRVVGVSTNIDHAQIVAQSESTSRNFINCVITSGVGIPKFRVNTQGTVFADGAYTGPADFAEMIRVSTGASTLEPGDVVVVDPSELRSVVRSETPHSTLVMGVYSTEPGFVGSERDWHVPDPEDAEGSISLARKDMAELYDEVPVAVVGIVPCKVSAEGGAIQPGDLLVTSSTPGHAMRSDDPRTGTVVGKALEPLPAGKGLIRILVTLQ